MKYAILYNVFCCWAITAIGAATARHILLYRDRDQVDRSFALFWASAAWLWLFVGLRLLFYFAGFDALDRGTFYVVQLLVALHLLPGVMHTASKVTTRREVLIVVAVFSTLLLSAFFFFVLWDGVEVVDRTSWASEYAFSRRAFLCFLPIFAICVFGNVYDICHVLVNRRFAARRPGEHTGASVAMLFYLGAGIFDAKGVTADWRIVIIRATLMFAALISYTCYTWKTEPDILRDTVERSDF